MCESVGEQISGRVRACVCVCVCVFMCGGGGVRGGGNKWSL